MGNLFLPASARLTAVFYCATSPSFPSLSRPNALGLTRVHELESRYYSPRNGPPKTIFVAGWLGKNDKSFSGPVGDETFALELNY